MADKKEKLGQEPASGFMYEQQDDYGNKYGEVEPGITRRFYAATAILQGLMANPYYAEQAARAGNLVPSQPVKTAYALADELLKQEQDV